MFNPDEWKHLSDTLLCENLSRNWDNPEEFYWSTWCGNDICFLDIGNESFENILALDIHGLILCYNLIEPCLEYCWNSKIPDRSRYNEGVCFFEIGNCLVLIINRFLIISSKIHFLIESIGICNLIIREEWGRIAREFVDGSGRIELLYECIGNFSRVRTFGARRDVDNEEWHRWI